jgi:uncharacterized membrane protein YhaH (DUF805 family)
MTKNGSRLNWFQRHPNSVMFLAWLVVHVVLVIIEIVLQNNASIRAGTREGVLGACYIVAIIFSMLICGWAMRQKDRSLWWVLLLLLPFVWILVIPLPKSWRIGILTKEQMQAGLYLEKEGNLFILKRGNEVLTNFYSKTTTIPFIREEAQKYV